MAKKKAAKEPHPASLSTPDRDRRLMVMALAKCNTKKQATAKAATVREYLHKQNPTVGQSTDHIDSLTVEECWKK